MEESSEARKARLKALRASAEESGAVPARSSEDECVLACSQRHCS